MPLEFLFGVALLIIIVYIVFRIVGNIALGALLVLIVFLASYLLLGSFPSIGDVPIIGSFIPTTGKASSIVQPNFAIFSIILIAVLLAILFVNSRKPRVKK